MTSFELSSPQRLGRTVVIGYCDIGAAGIRALEGLSAGRTGGNTDSADGAAPIGETQLRETGRESLEFSGMRGVVFNGFPAMEAVHFEADGGGNDDVGEDRSVTLLKLNTAVSQDLSTSLAMAIVDRLAERGKALKRVVVAAAVQPPKRNQAQRPTLSSSSGKVASATVIPSDRVCVFLSPGYRRTENRMPPAGVATLPASTRVADSFLTTLIMLCQLEEVPLLMLARVGYRATGGPADVDGTDEAVTELGLCLAQTVGLEFDAKRACGVSWSKGWKLTRPSQGAVPGYI